MNPDFLIRAAQMADASGIAEVHVNSWQATYPGIFPADYLAQLSVELRTRQWLGMLEQAEVNAGHFVVLEPRGKLVGFASCGPERAGYNNYPGELIAIYLLPEWQKQGLGYRLFQRVVSHLRGISCMPMLIWVAAANTPARQFYERCGAHHVLERTVRVGPVDVAEVGYGWDGF